MGYNSADRAPPSTIHFAKYLIFGLNFLTFVSCCSLSLSFSLSLSPTNFRSLELTNMNLCRLAASLLELYF